MSLNLIADKWIPAIDKAGRRTTIAPWEMARPDIADVDWERTDFNVACVELLIGMAYMACAPEDLEAWEDGEEIQPEELKAALEPFRSAFDLISEGPVFAQDFDGFDSKALLPAEVLMIDSAGDKTIKDNKDILVRRNRYRSLSLPEAAMALFTLQTYAPANGSGKRVGLRGGGPMTTLVDPGTGLWGLVWANVPYGTPAEIEDLPWMRPAREHKSGNDDATVVLPVGREMKVETLLSLPRRIRLIATGDRVTHFKEMKYGANYVDCLHPLTPSYEDRKSGTLIPCKVNTTRIGYDNWIGTIIPSEEGTGWRRAQTMRTFEERYPGRSASAIIAGWNVTNATANNFLHVRPVIHALDARAQVFLRGMIKVADGTARLLSKGIADSIGTPGNIDVRALFFDRTETDIACLCDRLERGEARRDIGRDWLKIVRRVALDIHDELTLPQMTRRDLRTVKAIVDYRMKIIARHDTSNRSGAAVASLLELDGDS